MPSIVRTFVPWLVAYLLPLAGKYLGLTEDQLSTLVTLLLGAGYYVAVRVLERWVPQASILLGSLQAPTYARAGRTVVGEVVDQPAHRAGDAAGGGGGIAY